MNKITTKHLRYFEALARHGHYGRAAEDCAISQPALSVQMKEFEAILGAALVEKGSKPLRLTSLGEELVIRARAVLGSLDEITDLARASHAPLQGRLRVGVIPTVAPYFLPQVISTLSQQYPSLELWPREATTQRLIKDLLAGDLDAAIVALPVSEDSLYEEALFDEEFVLVRPLESASKPVPDSTMLREMRLLLLEEGHCFRDQALSYCDMSTTVPRDIMEGSSLSTLVQMVGAGIGVTLIPEMAVGIDTHSADVSVDRLAVPRPSRTIGVVWRKTNPLSDHLKNIAETIRASYPATPKARQSPE